MHCYLKARENGIWYIWQWDPITGQCPHISTHTRDKSEAEQALAKHILSLRSPQKIANISLAAALVRYWELHGSGCYDRGVVKTVMGVVAEHEPETLVAEFNISRQKHFVEKLGVSSATAKRYLGKIQTSIKFLADREELDSVPKFYRVAVTKGPGARPFSIEQLQSLSRASSSDRHRLFLTLSLATLSRPCALLDLTWDRVDTEAHMIHLAVPGRQETKKRRPIVRIPESVSRWLGTIRGEPEELVINFDGKRLESHRMMFDRLALRAGVKGSAYGLRKAAATWLRRHGVPELDIKGMLGHRMPGATEEYAHYDPKYLKTAAGVIEEMLRAVGLSWLSGEEKKPSKACSLTSYLPVRSATADFVKISLSESSVYGAGKEARTPDLNLGKDSFHEEYQQLKAANDD